MARQIACRAAEAPGLDGGSIRQQRGPSRALWSRTERHGRRRAALAGSLTGLDIHCLRVRGRAGRPHGVLLAGTARCLHAQAAGTGYCSRRGRADPSTQDHGDRQAGARRGVFKPLPPINQRRRLTPGTLSGSASQHPERQQIILNGHAGPLPGAQTPSQLNLPIMNTRCRSALTDEANPRRHPTPPARQAGTLRQGSTATATPPLRHSFCWVGGFGSEQVYTSACATTTMREAGLSTTTGRRRHCRRRIATWLINPTDFSGAHLTARGLAYHGLRSQVGRGRMTPPALSPA